MNSHATTIETLKSVRGNAGLLLFDGHAAWHLKKGTVAVFAVRVKDQSAFGPRKYLFSCNQGDWLFNQPSIDGEFGFLAVGLEDSLLERMEFGSLVKDTDANETKETKGTEEAEVGEKDGFASQIDAWVRRVESTMRVNNSPHAEVAKEGKKIEIAESECLKAPIDLVLWCVAESGQIRLSGEVLESAMGWMPLCGEDYLIATSDATARIEQSKNIRSSTDLLVGLSRYHRIAFAQLTRNGEEELSRNALRLEERQKHQHIDTQDVLRELGSVLFRKAPDASSDDPLLAAMNCVGTQHQAVFRAVPHASGERSFDTEVEAIARLSRVRVRHVVLKGAWWQTDSGPILARWSESGNPVALIRVERGYQAIDPLAGTRKIVDSNVARQISREATTLIPPLPDSAHSLAALGRFAMRPLAPEILIVVFIATSVSLLGMLVPISTGLIIDEAIPDANLSLLYQLSAGLLAMAAAQAALSYSQTHLLLRIDTGLTASLQTAVIDRLLRLPGSFFRRYSSGDLQNRAMMITEISREISHSAISGILVGFTASLNLFMCFYYNSQLAWIACVVALIVAGFTAGLSIAIRKMARKLTLGRGMLNGFQVQLITGVAKIQVAAAQQRAFNAWARKVGEQLRLSAGIQRAEQFGGLINLALQHATTVALYYFAARLLISGAGGADTGSLMLTMGTFLAFYAAFNKMISGVTGVSNTIVELGDSWAKRQFIMPLLEESPENADGKIDPGRLQGSISLSHISFRYREDGPLILNDVSIHANPGQFIAIVGPSGSGKSTLLRILLGFESPTSGSVCFDGQDLAGLDSMTVRRQIGAVLQSGVVNSGSLFENIAGSSRVSLEQTWEAARAAGLASDIEQMPMGMHTFINEGGGTLSGGQRQRLLIARSLVTRPKILIFDEATSALDNRTQQIVSESLERMQVTRIVVAHRLSTIREANRIYVLQAGQIVQSGTYEELSEQDGLFKRMIARQVV